VNRKYIFVILGIGLILSISIVLIFQIIAQASSQNLLNTEVSVPEVVNYQGLLTDNLGDPVSGTHTMVFALYVDLITATSVWSETQVVTVTLGLFNVYLGDINPLDEEVFNGQDLYLGVKVGADDEMTPRMRIATSPYAFTANRAGCVLQTWYHDGDSDTFGDPNDSITACSQPSGYITDNTDCDDTNSEVNPLAAEKCNDQDDNCASGIDEGCDDDGDEYCDDSMVTVGTPAVCPYGEGDCDDSLDYVNPGMPV